MERFIFEVLKGISVMPGTIYVVHDALMRLSKDERHSFILWEYNMHHKE